MSKSTANQVIVYHDETKQAGSEKYKGHVLLFVPTKIEVVHTTPLFGTESHEYCPLLLLSEQLENIRLQFHLDKKLHFNQISGKKWGNFDLGVRRFVETGIDALRYKSPTLFPQPLCCRLAVIFYRMSDDLSLYGGDTSSEKELRHDETVLRMLLKGSVNYLYDENNCVHVDRIITDGEPDHRHLDEERIVRRMTYDGLIGKSPLRSYAIFTDRTEIVHLQSDHKLYQPESLRIYPCKYAPTCRPIFRVSHTGMFL